MASIHSTDPRKPFIKQRLLALAGIPRGKVTEIATFNTINAQGAKVPYVRGSVLRRDNGGWIRMGQFQFPLAEVPAVQTVQ